MKKNKMQIPLSGIIPPMVTPLLEEDKLDYAGLGKLIEHMQRFCRRAVSFIQDKRT
jgi:hypothetical protein